MIIVGLGSPSGRKDKLMSKKDKQVDFQVDRFIYSHLGGTKEARVGRGGWALILFD